MFYTLVECGWIQCPECDSSDLVTFSDPETLRDTIACRECGEKDVVTAREELAGELR